jgi:NitT/TauT family transport system substrate-binding protein
MLLAGALALGSVMAVATPAAAQHERTDFSVCWSIYVGWMPWGYIEESGIMDKWADTYGISVDIVQINDYIESINQYTIGEYDGCSMTNMDALSIPSSSGIDTTALIIGDFSNGNDGFVLKGTSDLAAIAGRNVNLVELSVSHYLLARALDSVDLTERDISVVNTSDADMVAVYSTSGVNAVVTWNPLLSTIAAMPDSTVVFDSAAIPGEIIDIMMVNTDTLAANPDFGKALVGAWYEAMAIIASDTPDGIAARTEMGIASGTDLAGYDAQLATTQMFYTPAEAADFARSPDLPQTMDYVRQFLFEHGILGAPGQPLDFVGIEFADGSTLGNPANIQLRFDPTYMQMAADGLL